MASRMDRPVIEGSALRKVYHEEDGSELTILDGVNVQVLAGEAVAVIGASGAVSAVLFAQIIMLPTSPVYFMFIPFPIPAYIFGLLYLAF